MIIYIYYFIIRIFNKNLNSKYLEDINSLKKNIKDIEYVLKYFNETFSSYGWCAYESMDIHIMKKALQVSKEKGIESGEKILINYYKTDVKYITQWVINADDVFKIRKELIEEFFENHFSRRYYASIILAFIIIDGAINDYNKKRGFFSSESEYITLGSLVGDKKGLQVLKNIFNQERNKTNEGEIFFPYRNGILHGLDLNYANEYVACKCVCLLFAVSDWIKVNKEKRNDKPNKSKIGGFFENIKDRQKRTKEISNWQPKEIIIGKDVPQVGEPEDYEGFDYIFKVIKAMKYWESKNYGELSKFFPFLFYSNISDRKRAGECRKFFEKLELKKYKLCSAREESFLISIVNIEITIIRNDEEIKRNLEFRCIYEGLDKELALPWRNEGEWRLLLTNRNTLIELNLESF
ncbi:hypothetical protein [Veillonella intestinalis]|uniref:hypothetical protein n=1 Tax=Veillonella intestinalis TaxID=2941341 RepID=UPI002040BEA7|nr:hypothetical protein [Veillonella intestinalis]